MGRRECFAIYSRKSKYTGKGESIENQIEMCREYIRIQYGEEAAAQSVVYEDEGFSGKNLDRPQFREMMKMAKSGRVRAIVVYRLDRISRNIGDFANLINELSREEIAFISVKEQFDTGSPMGRAMMYISSVFSQLERETIAERIRDNLHELAKTGRWLGGTTPTGYESKGIVTVTIDGKRKKACMLEENPEEIKLVDLIYDQFYKRRSLTNLDAFLLQHACRTKFGNEFSRFAAKGILTNPVYMIADEEAYQYLISQGVQLFSDKTEFDGIHGIMAYNRTQQEKGKTHKINPMNEWIAAVGRHKGRIPGRKWVEIQEILEQNKSKNYKKPRSNTALLSGILRCGNCGAYMRPKLGTRVLDSGERIFSYMCAKKERSRRACCAAKNVSGNSLDEELLRQIKLLPEDEALFLKEIEKGGKQIRKDERDAGIDGMFFRNEQKINEGKIEKLVKALSMASEGTERYILEQIEELNRKNEALKAQAEGAERRGEAAEQAVEQTAGQAAEQSTVGNPAKQALRPFADTLSIWKKRDSVRKFVKEVIWDGEDAHVILYGSEYEYPYPDHPIGASGFVAATAEQGTEEETVFGETASVNPS